MTIYDLYLFIKCGDLAFTYKNEDYFVADSSEGWYGITPNKGRSKCYKDYDVFLDSFILDDGVPLRTGILEITDW